MSILNRKFYQRDTLQVARMLIGKKLVRQINGLELAGMIVETEAYCGEADSACHAHRGMTARNTVMFGEPGHTYVYFTYGMHYMLNLVTEAKGRPCAVLVRAILPLAGVQEMEARRTRNGTQLSNGPAKLCQALGIDKSLNGWDLTRGKELWVEDYKKIPAKSIITTPRIGIDYAKDEHRNAPWRFLYQV
jgi:DNA-3-methyladenine glycosylase